MRTAVVHARGPVRGGPRSRPATRTQRTTADRDEAEQVVSELYLPNRLDVAAGSGPLTMEVSALRMGALTAGRLTYGPRVRVRTADAEQFHVNVPLRGLVVSSDGTGRPVTTRPGEALVFSPGAPADMSWSADCEQLCLMVPRTHLETALGELCGTPLRGQLTFDFAADLETSVGRRLRTVLNLIVDELDEPTEMSTNPHVLKHVEALVVDGLLLGRSHSHSDAVSRGGSVVLNTAVRRAVDLLEERTCEPWTTVRLATEVHLSVRALQSGFRRELATSPMTYLREIRLHRARVALQQAERHTTTVQTVAVNLGILHMGRFAAAYREAFGEVPSQTLDHPA